MKTFEQLLDELGTAIGATLTLDENGLCEVCVQGQTILLTYQQQENLLLCFSVVETLTSPSMELYRRALNLNLFGYGTHGFSLGLFNQTFLLSGVFALEFLTAPILAESLYLLAQQVTRIRNILKTPSGAYELEAHTTMVWEQVLHL